MAFLDNSGDIILDAVLTDLGRQRLARGSFKIVKFALGDEEINYGAFNSSHPSGSAFHDLEIMQTPVLEAFTNNTSLMKSKLVSINRNNILYMPILKLNSNPENKTATRAGFNGYFMSADLNTTRRGGLTTSGETETGFLYGDTSTSNDGQTTNICVDQGINTDSASGGLSIKDRMDPDLIETGFLVRVDHRLLRLHPGRHGNGGDVNAMTVGTELVNNFVDDDGIALYYLSLGDNTGAIYGPRSGNFRLRDQAQIESEDSTTATTAAGRESFSGPLGTSLCLVPKASPEVQNSAALFEKIGTYSSTALTPFRGNATGIKTYRFIDTTINVVGITTGYSIDIPIRLVKGLTFA